MCYNRIAVLAGLRTELVNGTCNPSRGLAELSAPLLFDDRYKTMLYKIADHQPLAAALLWTRIAGKLNGRARIEALTLAAAFALKGGDAGTSARLMTRADGLAHAAA